MKLWLVRHARVALPEGICYGVSDVAVDAALNEAAASQLAQALPQGLRAWHSPLQRCELLALALQDLRPDLASKPDARLRELDFGRWEGQPWSTVGRAPMDAWLADFAHARPGGDGESVASLMQRVGSAFDAWQEGGEDAIWLTHAGVIRAVRLLARGVRAAPSAADWPADAVAFGSAWVLEL